MCLSRYSTASSRVGRMRSSSLYAGRTTLRRSSAGSITPASGIVVESVVAAAAASLSRRSASQRSYQHGSGRGAVGVPSGLLVTYVFSEGNGARGLGATRCSSAKSCIFEVMSLPNGACARVRGKNEPTRVQRGPEGQRGPGVCRRVSLGSRQAVNAGREQGAPSVQEPWRPWLFVPHGCWRKVLCTDAGSGTH